MDIGEVEMIIALPSPRNKLTHLGLVDLAKLRLQQRAHPETSGTFAEYASIRNSCHLVEVIGRNFYCDCKLGIKGKLCPESMALTYDRNPEFPVDPRFSTVIFKRKRPVGRPRNAGLAMSQRWIYLVMWPQVFFCRAEIFKSGFFVQIYSNQSVSCRNIGQVPLRVTKSCEAVYLDQTKPNTMYMDAIFILFLVPLFTKNGGKLTCCMIGGKIFILPCRKMHVLGSVQKYHFFVQKYYHVARLYAHILVQCQF